MGMLVMNGKILIRNYEEFALIRQWTDTDIDKRKSEKLNMIIIHIHIQMFGEIYEYEWNMT